MTKKQVVELFKLIVSVYPQFEVNQAKIDIWFRLMRNQNYERVMHRAERYIKTNKFPPTIADLREQVDETRNNDFLSKVAKWESEAVGSPRS